MSFKNSEVLIMIQVIMSNILTLNREYLCLSNTIVSYKPHNNDNKCSDVTNTMNKQTN